MLNEKLSMTDRLLNILGSIVLIPLGYFMTKEGFHLSLWILIPGIAIFLYGIGILLFAFFADSK